MRLKTYEAKDLFAVYQLFRETVQKVNSHDYSPAQITAWLGPDTPAVQAKWQATLLDHQTYTAWQDDELVGFADMTSTGYLDRLYVSADHQGEGIGRELVTALEHAIPVSQYETAASITARPFFMAQGYQVIKQNTVVREGIAMTNFSMVKKANK